MAIVLKNNSGRRLYFELPHDVVCTDDECMCTVVERRTREHNGATGEVGTNVQEVKVPRSVILTAKGASEPLPDGVLEIPAVAALIKRGQLLRDLQEQAAPPPPRTRSGFYNPPSGSGPTT